MKYKLISQSPESPEVTLWFLGWGFDYSIEPFLPREEGDVVLIWDYSDLTFDLDLSRWSSFSIKAWSMGVWAAEMFMLSRSDLKISHTEAYCGTARPADANSGIGAEAIQLTIDFWSDANRRKFARKIAIDAALAANVEPLLAIRSSDSQKAELQSILDAQAAKAEGAVIWDKAIVSKRDRIFPPAAQLNWWEFHACEVEQRDIPHWPF